MRRPATCRQPSTPRADSFPQICRSNPFWRKDQSGGRADSSSWRLTSPTSRSQGQLYDAASTILEQKLSQVEGVGQVFVGGSSLPAVRAEVNPTLLNNFGLGLEDVRYHALRNANANRPKGQMWRSDAFMDARRPPTSCSPAKEYAPLVVAYRNGAAV